MAIIDRETEMALDTTQDRYGRTVHHDAAAAAHARRNQAAVEAYVAYLARHADKLLDTARRALDKLPPARHIPAWRALLDGLAASHAEIVRVLDRPADPGSAAEREQHTAVWPHLAVWADHSYIATDLADQHHQPEPEMTGEERQMWTEMAHSAQRGGELDLIESWYAADGRPITLAYLVEDDTSTVIALAGDPGGPAWQVIGHYANEYAAVQALPRAVPPGVLRPDVSRFNRPEPAPEVSLQELLQDVIEAHAAGDVSEALLTATQHGHNAGPMIRLQELLETAAQFAKALESVQGKQVAARLDALGRQLGFLTREVHEAAEDLGATVAVLPPHRTPKPRIRPRPALGTTPPAPPSRPSASAHHR
ncbi:hypothetical protein J7I98_25620 [Streptomyces sp. ISL-98]|uniref:hypothetical protein n=1 Tax=Streptomyces sp. ISL-98 TaxID=2819192 RepID=UPI001BEA9012|nr:hypothetical protein [Streptomyces sp. ISL-98]MBT2509201.1 hypothetical protein [Streptomyces sp. ISL-98]